jgi:hypothetical protein
MKYLKPILFVISVNICLTATIIAQSEQGYVLGMKNFEKSFPSEHPDWDNFDNLYMGAHYDGSLSQQKLNLSTKKIIGQEMIFEFDLFTVELVINSNFTIVNQGANNEEVASENTKIIHLDNHRSLISWLEANKTYVTMYADFQEGKASAFLYNDDSSVASASGSIKMKK